MFGMCLKNQLHSGHYISVQLLFHSVIRHYERKKSMRSVSAATIKDASRDDLCTEAMMSPLQINTYAVVGKETGHKGEQS